MDRMSLKNGSSQNFKIIFVKWIRNVQQKEALFRKEDGLGHLQNKTHPTAAASFLCFSGSKAMAEAGQKVVTLKYTDRFCSRNYGTCLDHLCSFGHYDNHTETKELFLAF